MKIPGLGAWGARGAWESRLDLVHGRFTDGHGRFTAGSRLEFCTKPMFFSIFDNFAAGAFTDVHGRFTRGGRQKLVMPDSVISEIGSAG